MSSRSRFCVQPFQAKGAKLLAESARDARDEAAALRLGERLSATHDGVLVTKQIIDPEMNEYGEPVVIAVHGRVPPELDTIPF